MLPPACCAQSACGGCESGPHVPFDEYYSMSKINALCVYCGSSPGTDPAFVEAARSFGKILAENDIRLIYGGGSVGLMGALADAVIENGGATTGIIPEFITRRERPRQLAHELIVTRDMHERKRKMFERADGFVALPGGIGTLEELVEQLTWAQLGRHKKPILIANINNYWDPLLTLIEHMRTVKFVPSALNVDFLVADQVEDILPKMRRAAHEAAEAEKTMAVPAERL
jgi:uncharacterized protein (TIGR00730 family)